MPEASAGRVAVVTGGTGALGRQLVRTLLERGFRVHVPWLVEREARELEEMLGGPRPDLLLAPVDLGDAEALDAFFAGVWKREGRLDALCALVGGFVAAAVDETGPDDWQRMLQLNATSAFLSCRAAVPLLRDMGGGSIVMVASLPAVEGGGQGMSAYAAAKAAVVSLTGALARELRVDHVRVNAIAPEILDTPANRASMPADTPFLDPAAAAAVVAFLVGDEGEPVTGSVLKLMKS